MKQKNHFDATDLAIARMLQTNGRRSFASIASELDMAPSTVRLRLMRLIDSGLLRIRGIIHPADLGHRSMAMIALKVDRHKLRDAAAALTELTEVRWVVICTGAYDILIEAICHNNDHLLSLLSDKLAEIPGVRDTETFLYLDILQRSDEWVPA